MYAVTGTDGESAASSFGWKATRQRVPAVRMCPSITVQVPPPSPDLYKPPRSQLTNMTELSPGTTTGQYMAPPPPRPSTSDMTALPTLKMTHVVGIPHEADRC